jgi:hypothetical protein
MPAYDRVVDVLGEFVADRFADLSLRFADKSVRGGKAAQVWYSLQIPNDDSAIHDLLAAAN